MNEVNGHCEDAACYLITLYFFCQSYLERDGTALALKLYRLSAL